jgi:hypothetical protein
MSPDRTTPPLLRNGRSSGREDVTPTMIPRDQQEQPDEDEIVEAEHELEERGAELDEEIAELEREVENE